MLKYAIIFALISLAAGALGFGGVQMERKELQVLEGELSL